MEMKLMNGLRSMKFSGELETYVHYNYKLCQNKNVFILFFIF